MALDTASPDPKQTAANLAGRYFELLYYLRRARAAGNSTDVRKFERELIEWERSFIDLTIDKKPELTDLITLQDNIENMMAGADQRKLAEFDDNPESVKVFAIPLFKYMIGVINQAQALNEFHNIVQQVTSPAPTPQATATPAAGVPITDPEILALRLVLRNLYNLNERAAEADGVFDAAGNVIPQNLNQLYGHIKRKLGADDTLLSPSFLEVMNNDKDFQPFLEKFSITNPTQADLMFFNALQRVKKPETIEDFEQIQFAGTSAPANMPASSRRVSPPPPPAPDAAQPAASFTPALNSAGAPYNHYYDLKFYSGYDKDPEGDYRTKKGRILLPNLYQNSGQTTAATAAAAAPAAVTPTPSPPPPPAGDGTPSPAPAAAPAETAAPSWFAQGLLGDVARDDNGRSDINRRSAPVSIIFNPPAAQNALVQAAPITERATKQGEKIIDLAKNNIESFQVSLEHILHYIDANGTDEPATNRQTLQQLATAAAANFKPNQADSKSIQIIRAVADGDFEPIGKLLKPAPQAAPINRLATMGQLFVKPHRPKDDFIKTMRVLLAKTP